MSGLVLRTLRGKKTKAGASKPFSIPVDESLGLKQGDLVRVRVKGLEKWFEEDTSKPYKGGKA